MQWKWMQIQLWWKTGKDIYFSLLWDRFKLDAGRTALSVVLENTEITENMKVSFIEICLFTLRQFLN